MGLASSRAGGYAPAETDGQPAMPIAQATTTQAPPTTSQAVPSTRQTPTVPQKAATASASKTETTGKHAAVGSKMAAAAVSLAVTKAAQNVGGYSVRRPTEAEPEGRTADFCQAQTIRAKTKSPPTGFRLFRNGDVAVKVGRCYRYKIEQTESSITAPTARPVQPTTTPASTPKEEARLRQRQQGGR